MRSGPPLALAGLLVGLFAACEKAEPEGQWIPVRRGDLVLEVDAVGTLTATRSAPLGPPSGLDERDFKISRMVAEGSAVKKGDKVLTFDSTDLENELLERVAERDSAAREIERKARELALSRRESELRVVEAEAAAHKARLKADLPARYTAAVEVRLAQIDLQAAEAQLRMAKRRLEHSLRLGKAELAYLRDRHARFAARVEQIEDGIEKMTVQAPIDGVVIYRTNWRGEKKKVGDSCWLGESCVTVTGVDEMEAAGEIDEIESARVAVGQIARLRLEALPEREWVGKVVRLRPNVYRQSPRTPLKVIGAQISLQETDRSRMRPGMQFRGVLETGRHKNVLLVPTEAIFVKDDDLVVLRKTATGFAEVVVQVGGRSANEVEIKSGLELGDRVALLDLREVGS